LENESLGCIRFSQVAIDKTNLHRRRLRVLRGLGLHRDDSSKIHHWLAQEGFVAEGHFRLNIAIVIVVDWMIRLARYTYRYKD
jgi:hypothetical protein